MRVDPHHQTTKTGRALVLRAAETTDAEAFLTALRMLFHESWRNLSYPAHRFDSVTVDQEISAITEINEASRGFMILAICDQIIAGSLLLKPAVETFSLHCASLGMGVLKSFQGQGIGYALLRHGLEEAAKAGIMNIELRVRTYNRPAIALYEKAGFHRVGVLRGTARVGDEWADEFIYQRIAPGQSLHQPMNREIDRQE